VRVALKKAGPRVGFFCFPCGPVALRKREQLCGTRGTARVIGKKSLAKRPLKGPWLAKNDLGSLLQAPDRPTMKRVMKLPI